MAFVRLQLYGTPTEKWAQVDADLVRMVVDVGGAVQDCCEVFQQDSDAFVAVCGTADEVWAKVERSRSAK